MSRGSRSLQDPATLVALLVLGQIVVWTLAPALSHTAPPLDVIESYMWGREWQVATFKHPALPSWVLEASYLLTGAYGWPAYLASQFFVAATFLLVFLLGRDMMGSERAAAGTLLLTGIAYYAWPTPEFNHNVAETPFWAALPFALWRAVERRSILWWAIAGAAAAGGMYAKFTTALLLATAAAWIVLDARARQALMTPGPWLGLAVFAVLIAPLMLWLVTHDFAPLKYAAHRTVQDSTGGVFGFLLNLLLNIAGMLVMLAVAGLFRRGAPIPQAAPEQQVDARARRCLLLFTAGPLVLAIVGAVISRTGLKSAWGSSMFNLIGLLALALVPGRIDARGLRRIAACAVVALTVVPIGYGLVIGLGPRFSSMATRVQWPQAEISDRIVKVWARETGRPLRIVAGDDWIAALVGLTAKDRPSILSRGETSLSPWITPDRMAAEGMLVVWDVRSKRIPASLVPIVASSRMGEEKFAWPRPGKQPPLVLGYAIVPPVR